MTTPATIFVSTLVEKDGGFLMIQEGKNNHNQRGKWNFPAGHAELGESLADAAVREVKEEAGYEVKIDGIISILKEDIGDEMMMVFFFKGSLLSQKPDAHEAGILDVRFVPFDKISELDLRFDALSEVAQIAQNEKFYPLDLMQGQVLKGENNG
jgi:8-oxo-dGTP pyrophosphatase MutT (NUDIX family)